MATLEQLMGLVDSPTDMTLKQAESLYRYTSEFGPDVILELGRGYGNSTCVFTEYSNREHAKVISVGYEEGWRRSTVPRVVEALGEAWLQPLRVIDGDICAVDYQPLLAEAERPLVFWDAHGRSVAKRVLHGIVPTLPAESRVVVHDMAPRTNVRGEWRYYRAGPLASSFIEVIPLWWWIRRNRAEWTLGDGWVAFSPHSASRA